MKRERVQERFQTEVVADSVELIDGRVQEVIDWMVDRNLKQWRAIVEYVNRRRQAQYDEHLIGEVGDGFEYNRSQLLQSVGQNAAGVVKGYNREQESWHIAQSIQDAVAQTALAEVGAVGLGTAVVVLATTRVLDATGILAAGVVAGLGLFIIPNKRRKAREEFRERTDEMRARLSEVVRRQFSSELDRSIARMREAIAPYTRFVRLEHARMTEATTVLKSIDEEIEALRGR